MGFAEEWNKKVIEMARRAREDEERVSRAQNGCFAHDLDAVFVGGRLDGQRISHEMLMMLKNTGYTLRFSQLEQHNERLVNLDLEDQPIIEGYLSPMLDGGVLRYETQDVYDRLSR